MAQRLRHEPEQIDGVWLIAMKAFLAMSKQIDPAWADVVERLRFAPT
jgi:hypothetical protein